MLSPKLQIEDVHNTLVEGLRNFIHSIGATKVCLGLSGGIDSAVVADSADTTAADSVVADSAAADSANA